MSTAAPGRVLPPSTEAAEPQGTAAARRRRRVPRWLLALTLVAGWLVVWAFTKGQDTLALLGSSRTNLHEQLSAFRDSLLIGRETNPFMQVTYTLGGWFDDAVDWLKRLFAVPDFPRPVPQIGWLGVMATATWIGLALAGWRIALLVGASFFSFGLFGYWSESISLLIVTFLAVACVVLIGLPLGVLVGNSPRANTAVSAVLDLMQTIPSFVYLLPVVLFVGIGSSAAVVCTLIYALPPLIRISGHGIRSVSAITIEATDSAGQTRWQRLSKVQLPLARRTIIVGLNQAVMAALAMATIASFVNGPGLGEPVLAALVRNDVGGAFVPGALIVVMAVMLDRTITAASERRELLARSGPRHQHQRRNRVVVVTAGALAVVAIYLSRLYSWAAQVPTTSAGTWATEHADSFVGWFTDAFGGLSEALRVTVTVGLLNPAQSLLAESPWWITAAAILALATVIGGWRAAVSSAICVGVVRVLGLWHDAMITLTMTLVATLLVMVLAVVLGVWMARRRAVDVALRPLLDAGQSIPSFVYLIPALALFGPTRFTAIVAGIVYAAPAAIKLVADGVARVSPSALEAARAAGASSWQEITKVQLPLARPSLVLAANQGLLYVLAMAVIGGMVGAGALGYDVMLGFNRSDDWGKGAAAGLTIALLGILVDRITRAAARRSEAPA